MVYSIEGIVDLVSGSGYAREVDEIVADHAAQKGRELVTDIKCDFRGNREMVARVSARLNGGIIAAAESYRVVIDGKDIGGPIDRDDLVGVADGQLGYRPEGPAIEVVSELGSELAAVERVARVELIDRLHARSRRCICQDVPKIVRIDGVLEQVRVADDGDRFIQLKIAKTTQHVERPVARSI